MSISAIVMFIVACTLVWGGLVASVIAMNKFKAPWQLEESTCCEEKE